MRIHFWSLLLVTATIGCELVLGFEEHTLGPVDGGSGGTVQGGGAGTEGGLGGTTGGTAGGGSGGTAGTGGTVTAGAAGEGGASGSGGEAGEGGMGGAGGACSLLCDAGLALVHRYRFDGTGTAVVDSVGDADGTVVGGSMLAGTGTLTLPGANSGDYVDLPNGIISELTDATIEAWVTWNGGTNWQRVFDFGSSTMAEGMQGQSVTSLYITPKASAVPDMGTARASFTLNGQAAEQLAIGNVAVTASVETQLVVVIDGATLRFYHDGVEKATTSIGALADLNDVNNWLGRSQWSSDDEFGGIYDDFRIYGQALDADTIAALHEAGADVVF